MRTEPRAQLHKPVKKKFFYWSWGVHLHPVHPPCLRHWYVMNLNTTYRLHEFFYCHSVDCVTEALKDAIRNDIKNAEAKLDSPSFSKYSKDSFFAASEK